MLQELLRQIYIPSAAYGVVGCAIFLFALYQERLWFHTKYTSSNIKPRSWTDPLGILRKKCLTYKFLYNGASIIEAQYRKSGGQPFTLDTPDRKYTIITSDHHIQELDKAPRHQLSLHAVAKDFLQPKHTMHGFEWNDQRGVEGTGFVKALRDLLTSQLPTLIPRLSDAITQQIRTESVQASRMKDGWSCIPLFAAAKHMVTKTNCAVFFPPELSTNSKFIEAALAFPEDVFLAAEIIRIFPRRIGPYLAKLATRNHASSSTMYNLLFPVVERRMHISQLPPEERVGEEPNDGIQWLINTTPKRQDWNADRLVGEIMGVWYGSLHTLAIGTSYAIIDLYTHSEYVSSLRAEVESPAYAEFEKTSEGLPVLDAFLKESARFSAFESTGIRRRALEEFRFSDGLAIPRGTWVCVPHRAMMHDEANYSHATVFDGRRFLSKCSTQEDEESARLSHRTEKWMVWGAGRITCPGRFYAVVILKLVLSTLLKEYECEVEPFKGGRSVEWRSAIIPKAGITLRVKPRAPSENHPNL